MLAQIRVKELRNLRTAWLDSGPPESPILYFLHGYPDSADIWQFQTRHFEKNFHVLCPYSRGTNPSEGSNDLPRYGSDANVLDNLQILDLVDPSQIRPIILIGHDLGAVHAWNLASHLGPRLKGLIIMNGLNLHQMYHRLKIPAQLLRSWYIAAMNVPYLPELLITSFQEQFMNFAYSQGALPKPLRPNEGSPLQPLNQYRAFLRDMLVQARQPIRKISSPTLVLWGQKDTFLLPPTLDEWETFADFVTIRYLNANHWVFRELPTEVNELMEDFFKELNIEFKCA